ncbi:MAG: PspC domain-containing protein [Flavobacteriaceae bacterium]|nr:PspC domain-containing protein [Flavobacteriaceae bacterium]
MNKTVSIALAVFSFMIEEHAYIKLNDYLNALRKSLAEDEVEEVMYDIEIRIAEIFNGLLGKREVVSSDDVERVIEQIGTPETIEEQEETYYSEKTKSQKKHKTNAQQKQLFRDPQNRKIAGVCSGLAHYIGIDVAIMRVIWVVSLFIFAVVPVLVFYALLWVVIPKAETASDFLKMKGKPIDFDNLKEESVRFASESGRKIGEFYEENKPAIVEAGGKIWKMVRTILGVIFIIFSLKIVIGMIYAVLGISGSIGLAEFQDIDFFFENREMKYVLSGMVATILLAIAILFAGIGVKFLSPNIRIRGFGIVSGLFIALFIGLVIYFSIQMTWLDNIYTGTNREEENIALVAPQNKLELDVKRVIIPQNFKAYDDKFSDKKRVFERDRPDVYITRKYGIEAPYLIVKKKAEGYNLPIRLSVPVEVKEGRILFPNYIGYSYEQRLRDYDVSYELAVPQNMQVVDLSQGGLDIDGDDDWDDMIEIDDDDFPFQKGSNIRIETPNDTITIKRQ